METSAIRFITAEFKINSSDKRIGIRVIYGTKIIKQNVFC
jgi:hypothetical protein